MRSGASSSRMIKGTEEAQNDEAGSIEIMKSDTDYKDEEIDAMVPATLGTLVSPKGVPTGCFDLKAGRVRAVDARQRAARGRGRPVRHRDERVPPERLRIEGALGGGRGYRGLRRRLYAQAR